MPRVYTTATIALALGTSAKWVDNALSHYPVSDVHRGTQGVSRRIGLRGVLELAAAKLISDSLGSPFAKAIRLSRRLLDAGQLPVGDQLLVTLNREGQARHIAARLEFAVEVAPLPRRGRPPSKAKRGA